METGVLLAGIGILVYGVSQGADNLTYTIIKVLNYIDTRREYKTRPCDCQGEHSV